MKRSISLLILVFNFLQLFGQYFEGEMDFEDYYLDKNTMKPLFDPKLGVITIKGGVFKIFFPNAKKGALEWEINDYPSNVSFSRKSYKDIDYAVSDKPAIISKDGYIQFPKPDSSLVAPIRKGKLCHSKIDSLDVLTQLDTSLIINGLTCKVITRARNGVVLSEYYYCDSIKLNPLMFNCNRFDKLDKLYKKTNGAILVQLVEYLDLYIWIEQIQVVRPKLIDDVVFDLPKGVKIEESKN